MVMSGAAGCREVLCCYTKEEVPGMEILHRNTNRIKFNRNEIISGKLSDRQKILDNVTSNKNIIKTKTTRKNRITSAQNW
jgi:hypothetical protein